MKIALEQRAVLVQKLVDARAIAELLCHGAPTPFLVDMYGKTIAAIDRRISAIQDHASFASAPNGQPAQLGLYRGVSEWCEDDDLLAKVAEIEDYFISLQK